MLPKSIYMQLSPSQKKKVKARLGLSGSQGKYKIKGSGAYIYDKRNPYGHYGEKIGKYLGGYFGIPYARQIGAYGGHMIGKMFGSGAYYNGRGKYIPSYKGAHKVIKGSGAYYNAPKTVATNATSPPSFGSNRTIVRHREFIGNIQGSMGFEINTWNVNPGDESTFPWLSTLAQNYEKYRPIGVIFEFKSTSANALNSTNTALGTVMMAPRYNAVVSSVPGSKMEMLQIENCVSVCPAESAMCGIECAKNYNPLGVLYIRNGSTNISNNEQMFDFADFYLATEGMQAVATIGELWVTYEIELLTPILNGGQVGNQINWFEGYATSGISTSAYFGSNFTMNPNSNLNISFVSGSIIEFDKSIETGMYRIGIIWMGASTACTVPSFTTSDGAELVPNLINTSGIPNQLNVWPRSGATTTDRLDAEFIVRIRTPSGGPSFNGPRITLSGATLPTSLTGMQLRISQIPDDAYTEPY